MTAVPLSSRRPVRAVPPADEPSDTALVAQLQRGDARAASQLFTRHAPRVERMLGRILGPQADVADGLNETFRRGFDRLDRLDRPEGVGAWLSAIAVMVAREELRARKRRRWLEFFSPEVLPEPPPSGASDEDREALARVFLVLDEMHADDRVVFVLRYLEGFELTEVAAAIDVSLASAKRYLARAEKRFFAKCAQDPLLAAWNAEAQEESR